MATRFAALALALAGLRGHPMHSAVTEIEQQDAGGTIEVRVKVFADDLATAVPLPPDPAAADSARARYLRGTFALVDRSGRPVRLAWVGSEPSGDAVTLRLRGEVRGGLAGARVTSLVLCERFEDEVNVVRAAYGGRTETLLFTRGESSKALP